MISNFDLSQIPGLVKKQLSCFFPLSNEENKIIEFSCHPALLKSKVCFGGVDNKYFHRDGDIYFSPFHSGQWLIFLYYLANSVSTEFSLIQINKSGG